MNSKVLILCLSPPGLCATFIPCILGCKVAQDNGDSCCLPFLPGAMIALRTSMRSKYHIDVSVIMLSTHTLDHQNNGTADSVLKRACYFEVTMKSGQNMRILMSLCFFPGLGVWWLGDHGLPASVWTVSDGSGAEEERMNEIVVECNFKGALCSFSAFCSQVSL